MIQTGRMRFVGGGKVDPNPIRIRPDQIVAFERETGGKLRLPPRLALD